MSTGGMGSKRSGIRGQQADQGEIRSSNPKSRGCISFAFGFQLDCSIVLQRQQLARISFAGHPLEDGLLLGLVAALDDDLKRLGNGQVRFRPPLSSSLRQGVGLRPASRRASPARRRSRSRRGPAVRRALPRWPRPCRPADRAGPAASPPRARRGPRTSTGTSISGVVSARRWPSINSSEPSGSSRASSAPA